MELPMPTFIFGNGCPSHIWTRKLCFGGFGALQTYPILPSWCSCTRKEWVVSNGEALNYEVWKE